MGQWTQESRAKSLINRSSVVTQALMMNVAKLGLEPYQRLQALESTAVAAGATYDVARAALQAFQVRREQLEENLTVINSACLLICRVRGVSAALFEQFDKGDALGLASHLEAPMRRITGVGPYLADMLHEQMGVLGKHVAAVRPEAESTNRALGALNAALYQLEAGIASARALLAAEGVIVKFAKARHAKKPKPREPATAPPAVKPMGPSNGATGHVEPVPGSIGEGVIAS